MYKLLIIEDERWEREGLVDFLDWGSFNIEIVGTACDAVEGMEQALKTRPDIIITDIKMPGMDGITMSRKIKEILPAVKIIILTGYDDFQYARDAIDFNASGYLLKIMEEEELEQVLRKVISECDSEFKRREQEKLLGTRLAESMKMARTSFLIELLEGKTDKDLLTRQFIDFGIEAYAADKFIAAVVKLERSGGNSSVDFAAIFEAILDYLKSGVAFSLVNRSSGELVLCLKTAGATEESIEELKRGSSLMEQTRGISMVIGTGEPVAFLGDIGRSYLQARNAADFAFFRQLRGVLQFSSVEAMNRSFVNNASEFLLQGSYFCKQLVHALRSVDEERISTLLDGMFAHIGDNPGADRDFIMNYLQNFINEISIMVYQLNKDFEQTSTLDILPAGEEGFHYNLDHMEETIRAFVQKAVESINRKRCGKDEQVVKKVIKLVEERYASPDICLKTLAGEVFLSPNYLGSIFKKCTGKSINDYICEYRMEKARQLLMFPENKVCRVAAGVGIPNTSYFCTIFKNIYGMAPGEFQDSMAKGN